jgi:TP901 family phage tail tape measure protein
LADFVVEGGFDDRGILEGFKKLVDEGTKAGRQVGAGFEDELNRFGKRSVASLQQELARLESRQLRLNVDSAAFTKTGEKVKEIKGLIDEANKKKLSLQFDPASINGLTAKLQELQAKSLELKVGTKEYETAQIKVDALRTKIEQLSRVPVAAGSLEALNRQLSDLQKRQTKLNVDSTEFEQAERDIVEVKNRIDEANRKKLAITTDPASIDGLTAKLNQLQAKQVRLNVNSQEFARAEKEIQQVKGRIDEVEKRKLLLNADSSSIVAMQARLQELQGKLQRVAVGSKAFNQIKSEAAAAEQQIARATGATKGLGASLQLLAPALTLVGAVAAVGKALAFVSQESTKLDAAGAALRTLGANADVLETQLLAVSRATGSAASQASLLQAAYDVASSGFTNAADAAKILTAANLGAVGGFSDIDTVANATTSVLNAYGLSADKAGELVDGFIQTQNDGKIVVAEYAAQIGKLAPIAASAGVGIRELNAAIAVATAQGVKPEAAITGLRQAISAILKPTAEASELAARLGIGFSAQALQAKGLSGVLQEVSTATGGAAGLNLQLFSSTEALAAVQPSLTDGASKYTAALEKQNAASGVAQKSNDEVANTIEGASKRVQGALSNLATYISGSFAPVAINALNFVGKTLEDLQTLIQATNLQEAFGFSIQESLQLVGALRQVEEQYGLTAEQSKNLLSNAIANSNASKDWFGNLKAGGDNFSIVQEGLIDQSKAWSEQRIAGAAAAKRGEDAVQLSLAEQAAQLEKQVEILRSIGESRETLLKTQEKSLLVELEGTQSLADARTKLFSTLSSLEQARFNTVVARNKFEIDNAEKLGLTQEQVAQRQTANEELQKQALIAKYGALLQQQKLEQQMLGLKQEQAAIEAVMAAIDQQRLVITAQRALAAAEGSLKPEEIARARNLLEAEKNKLGFALERIEILKRLQPIESGIAAAAAQTALEQLRAQGASLGIEKALTAATPAQKAFNEQVRLGVETATKLPGQISSAGTAIGQVGDGSKVVVESFKNADGSITLISKNLKSAATESGKVGSGMEKAKTSSEAFAKLGIDQIAASAAASAQPFASRMAAASGSAKSLHDWLVRASGVVPARFSGGPVEAGTRYRINDGPGGRSLGQESFLSNAGDLSLINRPYSSMWTAPTSGIVLPAAMTDHMKKRGAFDAGRAGGGRVAAVAEALRPSAGGASTARLELAVTNLAAQVQALNRKQWTVQNRVINSAGATQIRVMNAIL